MDASADVLKETDAAVLEVGSQAAYNLIQESASYRYFRLALRSPTMPPLA